MRKVFISRATVLTQVKLVASGGKTVCRKDGQFSIIADTELQVSEPRDYFISGREADLVALRVVQVLNPEDVAGMQLCATGPLNGAHTR